MWATFPMLREALDVIEAWGFSYADNPTEAEQMTLGSAT